jgi:hypothetical protein
MTKERTQINEVEEAKQASDFAEKMSQMAYDLIRSIQDAGEIEIPSWKFLSNNVHQAWDTIRLTHSLKIRVICKSQPIAFRSIYARCLLAEYIYDYYDDKDREPP